MGRHRGGLIESSPSCTSRCTLIPCSSEPLELSSLQKWTRISSGPRDTRCLWRRQPGTGLKTAWGNILYLQRGDLVVSFSPQHSGIYWSDSTPDTLTREEVDGNLSGETHWLNGKGSQKLPFGLDYCLSYLRPPNGSVVKNLPARQETQETWVQSLGQKDSPGGGNGNPLQYSCLKNPTDRGAKRATAQRVTESRTWLSTHCLTV